MSTIFLFALVTLMGFQESHGSVLKNNNGYQFPLELLNIQPNYERNARELSDVLNKIKSKIVKAWDTFKRITGSTQQRLKDYMEKISLKIQAITHAFENKLESLKNDLKKLIEKAVAIEESLKNCLQDDKDIIENLLKEIVVNVTTCITNNITNMSKIEVNHNLLEESISLDTLQNKITERLEACRENADQCVHNVKEEILGEIDNATWNVSYKAFAVRDAVDDSLDLIVSCATEGLTEASTSIFKESVHVIQCIKNKQ